MADRFDNLSVDQLQAELEAARLETVAIEKALAARLEAACPVAVDGVYRVKIDDSVYGWLQKLGGRIVKVTFIKAQRAGWRRPDDGLMCLVSVRPKLAGKKATPTADGFGRKHHWIDPARLEPINETGT
jgi:hypothetical protein